jgi:hypothetical protein
MKKIARFGFAMAVTLVFTACADFRVNMTRDFGPHNPPKPSPGLALAWVDVANWQAFLASKGFLSPATKVQPDVFDKATATATENFQRKKGKFAKYSLPATGCVNFATYHKAVQEGMPPVHPIRVQSTCAMVHSGQPSERTHDSFHDNKNNAVNKLGLGYHCIQASGWHDVSDWQNFLIANGYLASGDCTLGDFNTSTKSATVQFQLLWCTSTSNGYVNHETWTAATNFATLSNGLGIPLVGVDQGATLEYAGSCP